MRRHNRERGASMVEVGVVLPLLIVVAVGLAEVGFLVVDYVTVTNAARSGARTGGAAAKSIDADTSILEVIEEDICNLRFSDFDSVTIRVYEPEADGGVPDPPGSVVNEWTNTGALTCGSVGHGFSCSNGCPWASSSRDNTPPTLDQLGVEITYQHQSITGLMPFLDLTLVESAVMQVEPNTRG
ncbi:MAG TPA: TadE family protein [Acidimicrobiia bacterium]|nr:TadE family protein [Acidimicrobiia bacterium]